MRSTVAGGVEISREWVRANASLAAPSQRMDSSPKMTLPLTCIPLASTDPATRVEVVFQKAFEAGPKSESLNLRKNAMTVKKKFPTNRDSQHLGGFCVTSQISSPP